MATWKKIALATGTGSQYIKGDGSLGTYSAGGTSLNGTGYVKASGTTISYVDETYSLSSHAHSSISFLNDAWHLSVDAKKRFYFAINDRTYFGSQNGYVFRSANDAVDLATLTNAGSLTITGALAASNLSGTNTGDQNLSGYALVGHNHSGVYAPVAHTHTDAAADAAGFMSSANFNKLGAISGTNTGDQTNISGGAGSVSNVGYGNGNFTWYQSNGGLAPYTSSWASFLISNHGNGSNYYNQTIIMPFWGPPQYSRKVDNNNSGPWTFYTTENLNPITTSNIASQTVNAVYRSAVDTIPAVVINSDGAYYGHISRIGIQYWALGYGSGIGAASNAVLTWGANGNVGIGTTTPGASSTFTGAATKLDVLGDIHISRAGSRIWFGDVSSPNPFFIGEGTLAQSGTDTDYMVIEPRNRLAIQSTAYATKVGIGYNDGGQTATLAINGNVGIGTVSPASLLQITTSAWAKLTLETTGVTSLVRQASDSNGMNFTTNALWAPGWTRDDVTKSSFAYIQHLGNSRMEFRVAPPASGAISWNTAMVIQDSGNVGIGTTAPGAKLEIYSNTASAQPFFYANNGGGVDPTTRDFYSWNSPWGPVGGGIKAATVNTWGTQLYSNQVLSLSAGGYNNTTPAITIPTNGNVGIGTVTPRGILDVDPTAASDINFSSYSGYQVRITGGDQINVVNDSGGGLQMYLNYNNGANIAMVAGTSQGNVGIGKVSPLSKLDVFGAIRASNPSGPGGAYDSYYIKMAASYDWTNPATLSDVWGNILETHEGAGYVTIPRALRAPIFYDSADTTYYGDFAGTSWLRHLSVGDVNASNDGGWNARLNLTGSSHARLDVKSNNDGIITTMYSHNGQGVGRVGTMSNHPLALMVNGNVAGYAYANYLQGVDSVRAPIFYDSNDTSYYCDPNSWSRFHSLAINRQNNITTSDGGLTLYGDGNGTTSWMGFKHMQNSGWGTHGNTNENPGYATYFIMDSPTRGWIFRRSISGFGSGENVASISNEGYCWAKRWVATEYLYTQGTVYSQGDVIAYYSDERLKRDIRIIDSPLAKLQKIKGIYYKSNQLSQDLNAEKDINKQRIGVLAQDVQSVIPEAVTLAPFDMGEDGLTKSGENYLTVQYDKLIPLLIEAIKELKAEVNGLKECRCK